MANRGLAASRVQSHRHLGGTMNFNLSAPRRETFLVSIVIAILVVLGMIVPLPFFTSYGLGLLLIAYLILAAGVLLDNL
jgi:flagellar biosynthesis component FlhA